MATGRITKRSVDALQPGTRDEFLWDEDLSGFGLKSTPSGSKTYLVQFRLGGRGSKTQRYTIGPHGRWTPAAARERAEELLRLAGSGVDPKAEEKARALALQQRQAEKDRLSFTTYSQRFLKEYGTQNWCARALASNDSAMRRWISPVLDGKSLSTLTKREVTEVLDRLPPNSPALQRSIFALLRKLFNRAVERGDLSLSPMLGMKSPSAPDSRERVLGDAELIRVMLFADDLGYPFGTMVRLLAVTGQRLNEVAAIQWNELNREARIWTLPAKRAKNDKAHRVPLNELAVNELDDLAGGERWPRTGLVLTTTGGTAVSGFSRAKRRLDAIMAKHGATAEMPWRLHDLRRTFATGMQRLGVRFEVTEALLNHVGESKSGVAGVYQRHDWEPEKQQAMNAWASHLRALIAAIPS